MTFCYTRSYQMFLLILSISDHQKLTIITSAENIIKACEYLNISYIRSETFSLRNLIFQRKVVLQEVNRLTAIIEDNELHFSHTQFDLFCFILINRLNKKGKKTIFHNFEFVYSIPQFKEKLKLKFFFSFFYNSILKILYKIPLELRIVNAVFFVTSIKISYLKNNCYANVDDKGSYFENTLKYFQSNQVYKNKLSNLFIASSFTNDDLFDLSEIKNLTNTLIKNDFSIKMHPKLIEIEGLDQCNKLETFIPVELMFGAVTNSIVSIHSAALITASNFNHLKVISLLEIFMKEGEFKVRTRKHLESESKGKILFPKTIEEFIEILIRNGIN